MRDNKKKNEINSNINSEIMNEFINKKWYLCLKRFINPFLKLFNNY